MLPLARPGPDCSGTFWARLAALDASDANSRRLFMVAGSSLVLNYTPPKHCTQPGKPIHRFGKTFDGDQSASRGFPGRMSVRRLAAATVGSGVQAVLRAGRKRLQNA